MPAPSEERWWCGVRKVVASLGVVGGGGGEEEEEEEEEEVIWNP